MHLRELIGCDLTDNPIVVADHCYGCTAARLELRRGARRLTMHICLSEATGCYASGGCR